jgi:hypothetical protein
MQALSTIISQNNRAVTEEIKAKTNNGFFVVVRKCKVGSIKSHTSHSTLSEAETKKTALLKSIAADYQNGKLDARHDNDTVAIVTP